MEREATMCPGGDDMGMFLLLASGTCSPRNEKTSGRGGGGVFSEGSGSLPPITEQGPHLLAKALHNTWPAVSLHIFMH